MSRRGHEGPMDWAYDNGVGPIDANSPFAAVSRNASHLPASSHSFDFRAQNTIRPAHRAPSPQKADFTTPRKPRPEVDFDTSGADTPNSPDRAADSEATPDQMLGLKQAIWGSSSRPPIKEQDAAHAKRKAKSRRETFFSRNAIFGSGKQSEASRQPGSAHAHAAVKMKRSKPALVRKRAKDEDPDWVDDDASDASPIAQIKLRSPFKKKRAVSKSENRPKEQQTPRPGGLASFFTYVESHPHLPSVLSYYAQLLLNVFLIFSVMAILWSFWSTIQADVDEAAAHAEAEALTEIALCAKNYKENGCGSATRVPALEAVCANWERCLERDAKKVGRARVSAHTFARIFNSFIEPISYKAMIFTLLIIFGTFLFSNLAFGFFRSKAAGAASVNYQQPYMPYAALPPPTPSRHASDNMLEGPMSPVYFTPHHQRYQQPQYGMDPAPSIGAFGRAPSGGSPIKKLDYA